jgi:AraC-like DNA-binding protein
MHTPHQHSEIEINLALKGGGQYLFGGQKVALEAGSWVVFWGALPHRLIYVEEDTHFLWFTLPLADFLRFGLLERLTRPVLYGELVYEQNPADLERFAGWLEDWPLGDEYQRVVRLELEARLRRLALKLQAAPKPWRRTAKLTDKAVQMAQFVVQNYPEALSVAIIAETVSLNPNYASSLFKQTFGMTLLAYLTQHRLAHAQRLLATSDRPVLEIAFEAGFGSSSRFYAAFIQATGQSPTQYRKRLGATSDGR